MSCADPYRSREYRIIDHGIVVEVKHQKYGRVHFDAFALFEEIIDEKVRDSFNKNRQKAKDKYVSSSKDWLDVKSTYKYKIKLANGKTRTEKVKGNGLDVGECIEILDLKYKELVVGANSCDNFIKAHNKALKQGASHGTR